MFEGCVDRAIMDLCIGLGCCGKRRHRLAHIIDVFGGVWCPLALGNSFKTCLNVRILSNDVADCLISLELEIKFGMLVGHMQRREILLRHLEWVHHTDRGATALSWPPYL